MTLTYTEQRPPGSPSQSLDYAADGDVLTVTHRTHKLGEPVEEGAEAPVEVDVETVDEFDFTDVEAEGVVNTEEIETPLPVQPVIEAHRDAVGEMHVTLLDWGGARG